MAESGLSANQQVTMLADKYTLRPLNIKSILGSMVVSILVYHTGDWGLIPHEGDLTSFFF